MSTRITRGHAALARWYAGRADAYPWRGARDPYLVLVSEIMLQQTQAARVIPKYRAFVRRFPTPSVLARASRADVLRAWGNLGYPRRAVALHEAARVIVRHHGGRVPSDPDVLRSLPGIGPYTAAAVSSLGFGRAVAALDVNVRRVVRRVVVGDDRIAQRDVDEAARRWIDRADPAGWNQSLMDVGREHCRSQPRCTGCPLAGVCEFRRRGASPTPSPRRQPRYEGSMRQLRGAILRVLRDRGEVSFGRLRTLTGRDPAEIADAVLAMRAEGLVDAGRTEGDGRVRGPVRLAD